MFEIKTDPDFAKAQHAAQVENTQKIMDSIKETFEKLSVGQYFTVPNDTLSVSTVKKHLDIKDTPEYIVKTKVERDGNKQTGLRIGKVARKQQEESATPSA